MATVAQHSRIIRLGSHCTHAHLSIIESTSPKRDRSKVRMPE